MLFVAHTPNASSMPSTTRKPYLGKIRRRERESAKAWRRSILNLFCNPDPWSGTHHGHTHYEAILTTAILTRCGVAARGRTLTLAEVQERRRRALRRWRGAM